MRTLTSTRSSVTVSDLEAVLKGIASDGGLFVDPDLDLLSVKVDEVINKDSIGIASVVLGTLLSGFEEPESLVRKAYSEKFSCGDVITPVVPLTDGISVLELFHGPTSAFKDVALSLLPLLMSKARDKIDPDKEIVILTATSGDTGKAALEGFRNVPGIRILVFYPEEGVSEIQKKQMVSQKGDNVGVCAVRGNFDDCQTAVKEAFIKLQNSDQLCGVSLSSANSINIGRLVPQVFYYYSSYVQLVSQKRIKAGDLIDFVVPTGNFGDILAGYYAKMLGLPIGKLVCASNANNVLTDFFETGVYDTHRSFIMTSSPSMDILVSSNLERLLYYAFCGNRERVAECMNRLKKDGRYTVPDNDLEWLKKDFAAYFCDELQTREQIRKTYKKFGYLIDPHTAVGMFAAEKYLNENMDQRHTVVLSTASPYKFTSAELDALGLVSTGSPFDDMRLLNECTGAKIPEQLLGLESAEDRFRDVINREELVSYVIDFVKKEDRKVDNIRTGNIC